MNRRSFAILLAVFVVMVAITVVQMSQPEQPQIAPDEVTPLAAVIQRVFEDVAVLDIVALRIEDPANADRFTLQRAADGSWTAPASDGELDANAASLIARTFVLLTYSEIITAETDALLSDYGFDPEPSLLITAVLNDESNHVIAIGGLTASGTRYYALVDDQEDIYLVDRAAVDFLRVALREPPIS